MVQVKLSLNKLPKHLQNIATEIYSTAEYIQQLTDQLPDAFRQA